MKLLSAFERAIVLLTRETYWEDFQDLDEKMFPQLRVILYLTGLGWFGFVDRLLGGLRWWRRRRRTVLGFLLVGLLGRRSVACGPGRLGSVDHVDRRRVV